MPTYSSHILEYAKRGAEHRYSELKAELALLVKHFPHLRGRGRKQVSMLDVMGGAAAVATPKRKPMSAAGRKRISEAQKKRWAATRKTAATKG